MGLGAGQADPVACQPGTVLAVALTGAYEGAREGCEGNGAGRTGAYEAAGAGAYDGARAGGRDAGTERTTGGPNEGTRGGGGNAGGGCETRAPLGGGTGTRSAGRGGGHVGGRGARRRTTEIRAKLGSICDRSATRPRSAT